MKIFGYILKKGCNFKVVVNKNPLSAIL